MEKDALHVGPWNGGFNPFFSLMLGTLSEQSEEKIEESQEFSKDAAIFVERQVNPLRGKG